MGKSRLERIDKRLKQALPVVLLVLLGYLGVALLTEISHPALYALEWVLLSYFVFELFVKWRLSASWREFVREHWLNIILVLPFLRVFRVLTVFGIAGRGSISTLRLLPYAQKLAKVPTITAKVKPLILGALGYLSLRRRTSERETRSAGEE